MRIGIDARLWGEPRSGIGRYTRSLVETLVKLAPEERWVLYLDRPARDLPADVEARCLPWPRRLLWTLWAARRDLARRPVDLFHGVTGFELPAARGVRFVTTVHDLVPFRFPRLVPWRHRWAVRCLLGGELHQRLDERPRVPADAAPGLPPQPCIDPDSHLHFGGVSEDPPDAPPPVAPAKPALGAAHGHRVV